jgi:ATP-dependent exoDNAse (exonuclease V) beta subunit
MNSSVTDNKSALQAADPDRNATVHASAGTGKTWLLVTRIVRLHVCENSCLPGRKNLIESWKNAA